MPMSIMLVSSVPAAVAAADEKSVVAINKPNARPKQVYNLPALHHLTSDLLLQGIILSEVLGKPISLRRGHRRP